MPTSGPTKPTGAHTFDGEEPTEVMIVPRPDASVAAEPEPENKDKQYVAPCAIPVAAVPDKEIEGAKIVLNIPDAAQRGPRGRGVAEERARRRAPTVKITRGQIEAAMPLGAVEPLTPEPLPPGVPHRSARTDELTVPDQAAIRIPIDVTLDDPGLLSELQRAASPRVAQAELIVPVKPISQSPPTHHASSRPHEPPATSMPVGFMPARTERSRAPWLVLGVLALGGGVAAAFFVTQPGVGPGEPASARADVTAEAATATITTAATPASSSSPWTPVATATDLGLPNEDSSAVASAAPTTTSTTGRPALASLPASPQPVSLPPVSLPKATAANPASQVDVTAAPRPTYRPPVAKTSDIPSGI